MGDGRIYTLNDIEHGVLRLMGDPRIHSAIVCCSVSCPDLRQEAYVPSKLEAQLNDQMREWLSNTGKGLLIDENSANLSRIFLWFQQDFQPSVTEFLASFHPSITGKSLS